MTEDLKAANKTGKNIDKSSEQQKREIRWDDLHVFRKQRRRYSMSPSYIYLSIY